MGAMKLIRAISLTGLVCLLGGMLLPACTDEAVNEYAQMRAFFRFDAVTSVHPLYTAVHNPGQWCSITLRNSTYTFTGTDGHAATANATSMEAYGKPECVAGFIVGTPSIPDLNGRTPVMSYDLACPSCYEEAAVQRSVTFLERERVKCPRCGRVYDLCNKGIVVEGEAGKKLYRYHVDLSEAAGGTLLIRN